MTVSDLIEYLKQQPQDLIVVHRMYSDQVILEANEIKVGQCCLPRNDGWVQNSRPDKPLQDYLILPGN